MILAERRRQQFPHLLLVALPNLYGSVFKIPTLGIPGRTRFPGFDELRQFQALCDLFGNWLVFATIGVFDYAFRSVELRKGDADFKCAPRVPIEKVVLPPDGLMWDTLLAQQLTEFCMNSRIITLPKRAEGIFLRVAWIDGFQGDDGRSRQFIDKIDVAIRAVRKPLSILGLANGTEHGSEGRVYYTASSPIDRTRCGR
jgi:hypothetical protein